MPSDSAARRLGFATAVCLACAATRAWAAEPRVAVPEKHRVLLAAHCCKCHSGADAEANFRLDDLSAVIADLETAERWQKVLGALNAGEMPPEGEPAVPATAKTDFLDDLSRTMVAARKLLNDAVGSTPMRRLNQREYVATMRHLLGVDVGAHELPADTSLGTFDTIAANLTMSSDQVEIYLAIAAEALHDAFVQYAAEGEKRLRVEAEARVPMIREMVRIKREQTAKAQEWLRAIRATIARNESPAAPVDDAAPVDAGLFWHWIGLEGWKKYPDPPLSDRFGFTQTPYGVTDPAAEKGRVNSAIHALQDRHLLYDKYIGAYYLRQPGLDQGAYFAPHLPFAIGWPYAFVITAPADWPGGDYVFRFRVGATEHARPADRFIEYGVQDGPQREKELLGTGVVSSSYGDSAVALGVSEVTGTMASPQVIEVPLPVNRGQQPRRNFFIRLKGSMFRADRGGNPQSQQIAGGKFAAAQARNGIGPEVTMWIDWLEIERLPAAGRPVPPGLAALEPLGVSRPVHTPADDALRTAFAAFVEEAWRGTPADESLVKRLVSRYHGRRAAGATHPKALSAALAVVLASPRFLYLAEGARAGGARLTDHELASRLSYFLWGAPPDATLRDLAGRGELGKPEVLAAQADRLLDDPRSMQFVKPFVHQWLGMDRLDFYNFNRARFPDMDDGTVLATREEVYQTVAHALRDDAPVDRLLRADYAVVNGVLALYYGLPGVTGDEFRKLPLPAGSPRGGLLGTAAVLAMGGDGNRTSPVERGAWVLRKLLNDPPPPAPPNVPQLARLASELLTTRERVRMHQDAPQCASCHRQIDPIGFGLENFDAAGRWRTEDEYQAEDAGGRKIPGAVTKWTIDASGSLHRGPSFKDYFELREAIAGRASQFGRGFAAALVEYALGRTCGFDEEQLVEAIAARAEARGRAIRAYVQALVASEEFRCR